MTPLRDAPIRQKLTACLLTVSAVAIVLMAAAFFTHDFIKLRSITLRQVSILGRLVALNSTASLAFDSPDDARALLDALADEPHIVAAGLYDERGRLFAQYPDRLPPGVLPAAPGPDGYRFGATQVTGFEPVVQKTHRLGTLYLRVDSGAILKAWVSDSVGVAALTMVVAFAIAYALSRQLGRWISRPVLGLADTAKAVAERQDYSVRAVKRGRDELGLLTDAFNHMLTQIQRLNQNLEQRVQERTAQLEAANRELEAFSYSVSHDLRAPLRHIDGYAGMLRKHADAALDEKGRRFLNTISDSAKRMGQLIDDLLSFSRIGRSSLTRVDVDHDSLVAGVIKEGRYEGDGRPAITWEISPLPSVRGDPALLRQVWANLIGNAVKYSGKNPHPRIAIASRAENGELVFSVSDNGVGFDMTYAGKLFGVFQRLHGVSEFEGTGIGLANVRRIVARHGGRTWAEGRVGEGATFYFSLPAPASS